MRIGQAISRRRLLEFFAASPLLAGGTARAETLLPKPKPSDPLTWAPLDANVLIKSPQEAINVFGFEPVMRQNVPPAHFGYMASGIDDEVTLRANREDFQKFQLRPRRLVDVSRIDIRTDILGVRYDSPIFICPTASNRLSIPTAKSRSRARRGSATTCKCSPPLRPPRSRRRPRHAPHRSVSSSMRRPSGRSPRPW